MKQNKEDLKMYTEYATSETLLKWLVEIRKELQSIRNMTRGICSRIRDPSRYIRRLATNVSNIRSCHDEKNLHRILP